MPITLSATPATPQPYTVTLTIAGATGPVTVTRTAAGRSLVVRNGDATSAATVIDYDPPFGTPLVYRAVDTSGASATADTVLAVDVPVVSHPGLGFLQVATRLVSDTATWQSTSRRHDIIGRADPVFTVNPLAYRSGTLTLALPDLPATDELVAAMADGWPILLRTPCADRFRDGWLQPLNVSEEPVGMFGPGWRTLRLDYQATGPPTQNPYVPAAPWTVGAVKDTHATVAEVRDVYTNVGDLTAGILA